MLSASARVKLLLPRSCFRLMSSAAHADVKFLATSPYVDVPAAKGLLPEGMCGELEDEFTLTGKRAWMIRDVSRVLCKVLDEYPAKNKPEQPSDSIIPKGNASKAWVSKWHRDAYPGYSDRPEWRNSVVHAQLHGSDFLGPMQPAAYVGKLKDRPFTDSALKTWSRVADRATGQKESVPPPMESDFTAALAAAIVQKNAAGKGAGAAAAAAAKKFKVEYPDKILLSGDRGVGKSAILNQLVMHARASGWLCLFVPNGWDHVQSGFYITPVKGGSGSGSGSGENLFDNPLLSVTVLRNFHAAHAKQLQSIPIAFPAKLKKYEGMLSAFKSEWGRARSIKGRENFSFIETRKIIEDEKLFEAQDTLDAPILDKFDYPSFDPKTLLDLVLLGVAFRESAGLVVMDLVEELKNLEALPVLLAVDQYNAWEAPSAFSWKDTPVHGKELCVPQSLNFIHKRKSSTEAYKLKNGLCVAALSSKHPEGGHETYKDNANSIPLVLKVPAYNQFEFISAVAHYKQANLISCEVSLTELLSFRTSTGSTGREMRRETVPTFFPLSVEKGGDDYMVSPQPAASSYNNASQDGSGAGGIRKDFSRSGGAGGSRGGAADDAKGIVDSLVQ